MPSVATTLVRSSSRAPHSLRTLSSTSLKPVKIVEVGPRDGLQNEKKLLKTELKVELIKRLVDAGCRDVESGSFVAPKWVSSPLHPYLDWATRADDA